MTPIIPFQPGAIPANTPGAFFSPGVVGVDFLTALVDLLRSDAQLRLWLGSGFGAGGFGFLSFGGARVWTDVAPVEATYPFVVVQDYDEDGPGLTFEDFPIRVTLAIVSNDLDEARRISASVKRTVDSPNANPNATARAPISFAHGVEVYNTRNNTRPRRLPSLGRGGVPVYLEEIDYTFIVNPYQ